MPLRRIQADRPPKPRRLEYPVASWLLVPRAALRSTEGRQLRVTTAEQPPVEAVESAISVRRVGEGPGCDGAALGQAMADPEIKALAKARSQEAIDRGVFGSPWMFVDGEPFWGWDRLPMIDAWLARGGW